MRWDRSVRWLAGAGVVAGIVSIYLCLVGVVENLDTYVIGRITVGRVMLAIPALLTGYVVARPTVIAGELRRPRLVDAARTSALAGLVTGIGLALAIGVVNLLGVDTVRSVFVGVKPELMSLLTFGHPGVFG